MKFRIPFLPVLPQPAGGVKGNVNEAFVPPAISKAHGSYHWDAEKLIFLAAMPLVTVPLLSMGAPISSTLDILLSVTVMSHFFIEFQSCITDYVQKRVYGKIHNYAMYLLYLGTMGSLVGIYNLQNTENGGFTGFLKTFFGKEKAN